MCELSDGVVGQVDVPASVQLAHASSVQQGLGSVQTTAAGRGSVDCRGHRDAFFLNHRDREEPVLSTDQRQSASELGNDASEREALLV